MDSRPNRLKQSCDAEVAHHSFEVVGEHMKAHFGTCRRVFFTQEVGGSYPIFERSCREVSCTGTGSLNGARQQSAERGGKGQPLTALEAIGDVLPAEAEAACYQ